jgi:protocatechuate 3,4-dioxygenase beta subunit
MTKRSRAAGFVPLLAVSALAIPGAARAQARPANQVQGRVLTADARPIAHARIVVVTNGRPSAPVFADDEGRFAVPALPADSALRFAKAGYGAVQIERPSPSTPLDVHLPIGAVLTGRVVDANGQPAVDVTVRVRLETAGPAPETIYADTDDRGEYRIGSLAPGRYVVDAHPGFDFSRFGEDLLLGAAGRLHAKLLQERASAAALSERVRLVMRAGEEMSHDIVYQRPAVSLPYAEVGGVITGVLLDEFGEPAEGVVMRLWQARVENGRLRLRPAEKARRTDDRGRYRLFHLPAGRYYLTATTDTDEASIFMGDEPFLPIYFPGSVDVAEAWPIHVARGSETDRIDMTAPRTRGARLRGVALDGNGRPLAGNVALVAASQPGVPSLTPRFVEADRTGAFEFDGIAPGAYVVQAVKASGSDAMHVEEITDFAMQRLQVGAEDVGPIVLTAAATSSLTGRVVVEGDTTPDAREFGLVVLPVDPDETPQIRFGRSDVPLGPDGRFVIRGLTTKIRLGLDRAPAGWWIRSANIGGIDAASDPVAFGTRQDSRDDIGVVLARTAATLSGRVVNDRGGRVESSSIVVFPSDVDRRFPRSRYVKTVDADSDGEFTVTSLPPGSYLVAAVEAADGDATADWTDPDALEEIASLAERVTLGEGQRATLSLRVVRPAR